MAVDGLGTGADDNFAALEGLVVISFCEPFRITNVGDFFPFDCAFPGSKCLVSI